MKEACITIIYVFGASLFKGYDNVVVFPTVVMERYFAKSPLQIGPYGIYCRSA